MTRHDAITKARIASEGGFVQHVNRSGADYTVSDWYDGDQTTDSFEDGERIGGEAPTESACPGCGCEPGDGITAACEHPDGCGYWKDLEAVDRDHQVKWDLATEANDGGEAK